jgi:hypothetical protein
MPLYQGTKENTVNIEKLAVNLEILNAKRVALDNQIVADVNKLAAAFDAARKAQGEKPAAGKKTTKKPAAKKTAARKPAAKN